MSLDDDGTRVPEARYCHDGSGHELGCFAVMSQHEFNYWLACQLELVLLLALAVCELLRLLELLLLVVG